VPGRSRRFLTSEFVDGVWETLGDFASNADYVPSPDQFACVRDCLMLTVELENARRTRDLINLTVNEFRRAKRPPTTPTTTSCTSSNTRRRRRRRAPLTSSARHQRPGLHLRAGIRGRLPRSTGLMFPHLSTTNPPTSLKMTPSEANVALNRVWASSGKLPMIATSCRRRSAVDSYATAS
jgi:hypothetical protein